MTAGELIRSARSRAGLSQAQLAERLSTPRSQIARWEADDVEPGFATVRRVLGACGFDLSMGLVPFVPDAPQEARLAELQRLTPKERLDAAFGRGGLEEEGYPLDPYAILAALEEPRDDDILIGSLARVIQGADEIPAGLDLTLARRAESASRASKAFQALGAIAATRPTRCSRSSTGASGYDDLRRKAERVHLGQGLRPRVTSPGDLVRMLEALGRPNQRGRSRGCPRRSFRMNRGRLRGESREARTHGGRSSGSSAPSPSGARGGRRPAAARLDPGRVRALAGDDPSLGPGRRRRRRLLRGHSRFFSGCACTLSAPPTAPRGRRAWSAPTVPSASWRPGLLGRALVGGETIVAEVGFAGRDLEAAVARMGATLVRPGAVR